jgi:hypothetical protein
MRTLLTAAACLSLAACGGGGSGDSPAPAPGPAPTAATAVPDSAIASPAALVGYLSAESGSDETSEPLTLPAADPATSETDEPQAV